MANNYIHRRYWTGILIVLYFFGLWTSGYNTTNPVIGVPLIWGVPFAIYAVCLKLWPDEEPKDHGS